MVSIVFNTADRAFQADLENRDPLLYAILQGLISGWAISQIAGNQSMSKNELVSYLQDPVRLPDVQKVAKWWFNQKASYGIIPSELGEIFPEIQSWI